jgi:hypothetical protein
MIEHITRQFVFDNYKVITSQIVEIQKAMFDSDPIFENGDDGKWYTEMHDALNIPVSDIKKYYSVVSFDHSDISTFTIALSEKITMLLTKLKVKDLVVIADLKRNVIGNPDNKYQPFQKAIKKFKDITPNLEYEEAFKISLTDLPTLIEIVFWIERCDTRAPEFIYFSDVNETIAFYLCKSGGIHIIEYGEEIVFDEVIENLDMYFVNGHCDEKFSDGSAIEVRQSSRN